MWREGLQTGDALLGVRGLSLGEIGLQARARLIHRHGAAGARGRSALQGRGAAGVGVLGGAGDLIDTGCDLPPQRGVLALQRVQLEETVSNTLRSAFQPGSSEPLLCSDPS